MGWANLDTFADRRGGTVAFNMVDDAQTVVDYERVVDSAAGQGFCLRGGCFCNQFVIGRGFPDRRPRRSAGRPS